MKKALWTLSALAVLLVAGGLGWQHRDLPQVRLLDEAERLVFADADSAARLLARVDTT